MTDEGTGPEAEGVTIEWRNDVNLRLDILNQALLALARSVQTIVNDSPDIEKKTALEIRKLEELMSRRRV